MNRRVDVVEQYGGVAGLHALDPMAGGRPAPAVWVCRPDDAAVVLGSRQTPDLLDARACRAAGLSVVRRRSGGGAVVVRPDAIVWIDLIVPSGVLSDDVRVSMVQVGDLWHRALVEEATAVPRAPAVSSMAVHRGGMVASPWSDLACFAGLGPGEITVASPSGPDRKLVGLSQRRGRLGARVQGSLYVRTVTRELIELLAGDVPPPEELVEPAVWPGVDAGSIARRLASGLEAQLTPV